MGFISTCPTIEGAKRFLPQGSDLTNTRNCILLVIEIDIDIEEFDKKIYKELDNGWVDYDNLNIEHGMEHEKEILINALNVFEVI